MTMNYSGDYISDSDGGVFKPSSSVMRNRIINGAMVIDQRNNGGSVSNAAGSLYTVDRWLSFGSQASKFTIQQNSGNAPVAQGFSQCVKITSSSAYSVGAGEIFGFQQPIEGYNIADFGWGTSSAKAVTLSFWVNSSLTGTFGGSFYSGTRYYAFNYSIAVANTWTQISITIAGDTTGTWVTNNTAGLYVYFSLGTGANYTTTPGSWSGSAKYSATGETSLVGTSGATFYITGVQLEVGSSATGFEYRQYGQELALCQRYFYNLVIPNGNFGAVTGMNQTTTVAWFPLQNVFRSTPTVTYSGSLNIIQGNANSAVTSVAAVHASQNGANVALGCGAILTGGYASTLYSTGATSYLNASAEL